MIVYNVDRRWFAEKAFAEAYRKASGLKPAATLKLDIGDRYDLQKLLNALCDAKPVEKVAPPELIDRAYVPVETRIPDCIPDFLLRSHGLDPAKVKRQGDEQWTPEELAGFRAENQPPLNPNLIGGVS